MKILVNSQHLAQQLRASCRVVPSKPVIPILSHVLFQADERLTLQTTDLEVATALPCPGAVEQAGVCALPAARLLSLVERFVNQDVAIVHEGGRATIMSGRFTSVLPTLPAADFPPLPATEGQSVTIDAARLRHLIARTRYAIATTETQRVLRGALLTMTGKVAAMATTDGKRIALATIARDEGADLSVVITAKAIETLAADGDQGDLTITLGHKHVFFTSADKVFLARVLNGQFPKYERIIPRNNTLKATVDRVELIAALQRVTLVADAENHAVTFELASGSEGLESGQLRLSTRSADGEADEQVQVAYEGDATTLKVNGEHVLDFLNAAVEPSVTLLVKDTRTPLLFQDGEGHLGVVAPVVK